MLTLDGFLRQIAADPAGAADTWLVLADWLQDRGDPRWELVRLLHQPGYMPTREQRDVRLRRLLDSVPPLFENVLGAHFAWVPPGTFWMGGGDGSCGEQEVRIEQGFALGVFPVTQGQWQAVLGKNPSWFSRTGSGSEGVQDIPDEELKHFPVESVSWEDAQRFVKKLNKKEGNGGWVYRLPTEAEWEYTCRGGASSREDCSFDFYLDSPSNDLSSHQANFNGNSPGGKAGKGPCLKRTSKVGSYAPNHLGMCDMHGNVWEWCQDWYEEGSVRVLRGGSWRGYGRSCRAASRFWGGPGFGLDYLGFRLARAPSSSGT